eukprot:5769285-Ditylum_brightwellii.AAC.1
MEGDMNAALKLIWNHQLVPLTEKVNFITPVQFGNRKGQTVLDAPLVKITTMDYIQLCCLNGAILNNVAEACYDRIDPGINIDTPLNIRSA